MVLLAQTSMWLIVPLMASADAITKVDYVESQFDVPAMQVYVASFYPYLKKRNGLPTSNLRGLELGESARSKWDSSNQQKRIEAMGMNGVIYFDAPPSTVRRRVWR